MGCSEQDFILDLRCMVNCRSARGNGAPPFYQLVRGLYNESKDVTIDIQLLSEAKLCKRVKKSTVSTNRTLFELWDAYNNQRIPVSSLLSKAARAVKR